jgi:ABC-type dipeptide/oligopeptide/nickel transport system ATPase component
VSNVEIDVRGFGTRFRTHAGVMTSVRRIDLRINEAEALCLAGESRSGESVTAHSIMRLLPAAATSWRAK